MAISPEALAELEKSNPDLVAKYRAQMGGSDASLQSAQDMQDYGGIANTAGKVMTDLGNAFGGQRDAVLYNSMQNLGKAPTVERAEQSQYDGSGITKATQQGVDRAKEGQKKAESDFWTEEKLRDTQQSRADAGLERADKVKGRAAAGRAEDPSSPESAAARDYLKQIAPGATQMAGFDSLSAAQIQKISPGLFDKYKLDESTAARKAEAEQRSLDRQDARVQRVADREAMQGVRRDDKADERKWKEEQTTKANTEKKNTLLNEIEDRRTNIKENVAILKKMIGSKGTWEATGSHNQDMDRLVDQIATDMAKLQDPSSVARPSEVEAVKKTLVSPGFSNKNSTAIDVLSNFETEVDRRADGAYTIRGIENPKKKQKTTDKPAGGLHGSDLPDWGIPMPRMSKNGVDFFDVDDSDDSIEAAKGKGYREYVPMTKNGKDVFDVEFTEDSYKAAIQKGYQDVDAFKFTKGARDPLKDKVDELVAKGGDRATLEQQAVRLGGKYKDASTGEKMVADAYRLGDNALLNVPSWIAKKMQDDKGEAQFDEIKNTVEGNRSTGEQILDVTGSIGSPLSLLTPGSVVGRVGNAAGQAAANNVARSDSGKEGEAALEGVSVGGAIATAVESLPIVGKAAGWVGKKAGRIATGVPEQAAERYLENPAAVNSAKPLFDKTKEFLDKADEIGGELSGDSAHAFNMLGQYQTDAASFTEPLRRQADRLDALGGFGAERKGAIKYLHGLADDVAEHAAGETITLDKGKGILNVLDKKMQVAEKQGADAQTMKAFSDARKSIDSFLKENVPEYAKHMDELAGDTRAMTGLTDKFRTDQGAFNTLQRIQRGKDKFSEEALAAYDKRFGTTYAQELKDSFAKEAFTKESTQGSRKTLGGLTLAGIPGMLAGMTADKFGGAIYKAILDGTLKVGKYAAPLQRIYDQRGPAAVAAAHAALMSQDPEYRQMVEGRP